MGGTKNKSVGGNALVCFPVWTTQAHCPVDLLQTKKQKKKWTDCGQASIAVEAENVMSLARRHAHSDKKSEHQGA